MSIQFDGLSVYPHSQVEHPGFTCCLCRDLENGERRLAVLEPPGKFSQPSRSSNGFWLYPLTAENAAELRMRLPWLQPVHTGLRGSFGFGDRIGLATPGHVRAARESSLVPVFAQQSVRENTRTGRTPQQVLDDAVWGMFQEGWRGPWGADADHLKLTTDVDAFVSAGYTFYTIDPGEHVNLQAGSFSSQALAQAVRALPWDDLEDTVRDLQRRYLAGPIDIGGFSLSFDQEHLWRSAVKYGEAVAHTAAMYRCIASRLGATAFDLEVSIDETDEPTTPLEHAYIALELNRMGVRWVSLAPRYVGRFEKGVDYLGDLAEFEREFARHAAIASALGPYKLSLHSGSDKFSIYPLAALYTGGRVHVKTAGTSYLEALKTIAQADPDLFRAMLDYSIERYPVDRATYHISADLDKVLALLPLADEGLPALLDHFDARQVLHVTYGSVLDRFGSHLLECLSTHEEEYCQTLEKHFRNHLNPFSVG